MRQISAREKSRFGKEFSALTLGWGARIRTWEWRNQNPLPYHLATPQNASRAWAAHGIAARSGTINAFRSMHSNPGAPCPGSVDQKHSAARLVALWRIRVVEA